MDSRLRIEGVLESVVNNEDGYFAVVKVFPNSGSCEVYTEVSIPLNKRNYDALRRIMGQRGTSKDEEHIQVKGTLSVKIEESPPF